MGRNSEKRMMSLLLELFKDSRRSDRELAKVLGVSQPTVSRMRSRLVKKGIIQEFTVIPDFAKIGYQIMAVTLGKYKVPRTPEIIEKGMKWMDKHPNIIFASRAQGMGKGAIMISLHKSYSDYVNFRNDMMLEFGGLTEDNDSVLVNLLGEIVRPLSLAYLGEHKEE